MPFDKIFRTFWFIFSLSIALYNVFFDSNTWTKYSRTFPKGGLYYWHRL
jgi:hypothetical protein